MTPPAPTTVNSDPRTVVGALRQAARLAPGKVLLRMPGFGEYTADELLLAAGRAAGLLQSHGVRRGDTVAIVMTNRIEWLHAFFGAIWAGAAVVPLNNSLRGPILENMLLRSAPRVVIVEDEIEPIVTAAVQSSQLDTTVLVGGASGDFAASITRHEPVAEVPASSTDLAAIMFTSGTTGPSKGVMLSHNALVAFCDKHERLVGLTESDVAYSCLPLYHTNALVVTLLTSLRVGAVTVLDTRFSASNFWNRVREEGATTINLLGAMVPILWNAKPTPLDAANDVRVAVCVPTPVEEYFDAFEERFGLRIASLYGSTDITYCIGTPEGERSRPGYCGVELPEFECRVVDEFDRELPDGEVGELVARPRNPNEIMSGYWNDPAATVEAWRNLWFHSGDLMVRESDGWYRFVDRKKDSIRRFGENISSFEVESVLLMHPAIAEATVYAVPSELSEDEVMAMVVLEPEHALNYSELGAHCDANLPYFAVPRYLEIVEELPKTDTEKVRKEVLRAQGVRPGTHDRGPRGRTAQQRGNTT